MHGFFQMAAILPGYDEGVRLVADHLRTRINSKEPANG